MARLIYSARALEDLERLVLFRDEQAPAVAAGAFEAIVDGVNVLAAHPLMGRRVDGGMRELVISRGRTGYLALYRFEPARDLVRVLRIRHQREAGYID